ncbi:hypothetical protein NE237_022627 [Protea cynaroides]|uniref:Vacuolar iron transporter n=1 Tax=Protea cynaroides TaxID=273540 RepID=A0A9Q0K603_9MAGN|nr:hypothetical protein NE237_022627 [Protea cynaroides]
METLELEASSNQSVLPQETNLDIPENDVEQQIDQEVQFNYYQRAQWLRAAVLGASDGLVSTASLMMGVGAVKKDVKSMIITGFAGMIAGAGSMAIGEFVSVYSQYDIEVSEMKRQNKASGNLEESEKDDLPNPYKAAGASALAFVVGAVVPLFSASFIKNYMVRLGVVVAMSSLALMVFGALGGVLGRSPVKNSSLRVLIGGVPSNGKDAAGEKPDLEASSVSDTSGGNHPLASSHAPSVMFDTRTCREQAWIPKQVRKNGARSMGDAEIPVRNEMVVGAIPVESYPAASGSTDDP